jgi:dihydroxyacetone kinase-like protein
VTSAVTSGPALPVVERVVRSIAQTAVDNEAHFSELDSVVGDGDFGFSLARGFEKVLAELDGLDRSNVGVFLKRVALIITSRCGGTSGPIWGTAFLRAAAAVGARETLLGSDVVELLRAAFLGIQQRGGAALGDKTLLDALGPFIDRFEAELASPQASDLRLPLEREPRPWIVRRAPRLSSSPNAGARRTRENAAVARSTQAPRRWP